MYFFVLKFSIEEGLGLKFLLKLENFFGFFLGMIYSFKLFRFCYIVIDFFGLLLFNVRYILFE